MPINGYTPRTLKAPAGIPEEAGPDFVAAVNEAAARGLTVWHMTEQWGGTWYCRLANPNSNSKELGDSMSYGRQGKTPGEAIRACMAQFCATPAEAEAEALRTEMLKGAVLEAIPYITPEKARRFLGAFERLQRAIEGVAPTVEDEAL